MRIQWNTAVIASVLFSAIVSPAQTYIFGRADFPVGAGPNSIDVGDFNRDGTIDLAVVNQTDNTVSILLGKPDGTFAPQVTYATGLGPLAIATADFNGDGNLDLAVTNADCVENKAGITCDVRTVSILLGNGVTCPQFSFM
jgi:FG-GAP-like repeat